ncbi:hypothetical protein [Microbacterium esteraromaticum]|uniref:hypothetical protein n=1 Tax=Microbacterium esteraromaticum TaxID=57043 RepID=UPI0030EE5DFC
MNGESLNRSLFSICGMLRLNSPVGAQRLEDVAERLAVDVSVVVARVAEAVVAVQDAVLTVSVEPADQVRFEVEADGLVEALADDDADRLQSLILLGAGEVPPHPLVGAGGLADVERLR